jgi:hypothetical protein
MTETELPDAPELTSEEYHAEWRELEKQFPVPILADVLAEWKWLYDGMADRTFDPEYKYGGRCVAIYQQQVVGTDTNWLRLRVTKSRELGVHPERIVITSFPEA